MTAAFLMPSPAGQQVLALLTPIANTRPMLHEALPWIAIGISLTALCVSVLNYHRDRAILQASSSYIEDWEGFNACIRVDIVNKGRRPFILSSWVGAATERKLFRRTAGSNWVGHNFGKGDGLTLLERQAHSFQLEASELDFELQNGMEVTYDDLWIEDTLRHKHKIKGIREDLESLKRWAAKQSPIPRTHVVGQQQKLGHR